MEKSIANGGEKVYEFMDFTPETWYTEQNTKRKRSGACAGTC